MVSVITCMLDWALVNSSCQLHVQQAARVIY